MSHLMEIQQRDNETLAAYVHQFKTEAKRFSFNSDTTTICIFIKGLWDAHNTAVKIYEKDSQTLSEVIRLVKRFNAAQQLTAMLTSSTVNVMSNNNPCFACRETSHIGCNCPDVQCYNCEEFGQITQDCTGEIPPLGTPCHHNRLCYWPCYDHNHKDRSQFLNSRHSHKKCFN